MTVLDANIYDGQAAARRVVKVKLTLPGYLVLQELGAVSRYRIADLNIPDQLGSQPARVNLPDGSLLEIADGEAFFAALKASGGKNQWMHRLESSWGWVAAAVLLTAGFAWGAYAWGIPALSKRIAYALPLTVDQEIGAQGLELMDDSMFAPTELDEMRQRQLLYVFMEVIETLGEDDAYRYQLEFRQGQSTGANAFALPAGIVVITDEMLLLAENDAEIAAIMAHEVGHIRNRHALRALLQNSVVAALVIALTGDVNAASSLAAGIPTLLARAGYSRQFEYEADAVAKEYLDTAGLPRRAFADIILRIDEVRPGMPDSISLLDTHPDARLRAREFE